jgi:small conductance mechanosensitive channel
MDSSSLLAQISNNASSAGSAALNGAQEAGQSEFVQTVLSSIDVLKNFLIALAIMVGFFILGKLISRRVVKAMQETKGESLAPDVVALANRFILYGALFVGFAVVIQFVFDLDFVQVLGFFGLGISFAFKDLLANLIAGAVIIIQNRFRVGDFIQIGKDGIKGKIMEIQTRATILKAIDSTEIVIPNAQLITRPVYSFTAHHRRRIDFTIGISFDADLDKAKEVAMKVMNEHAHVLQKPQAQVLVSKVGESAVELSMRFWIDPQNKEYSWIETKSELTGKVKQAFDREGVEIPFPIRTLKGGIQMNPEPTESPDSPAPMQDMGPAPEAA